MDNDFRYGLGWFSDYYLAKKHGVSRAVVQGVRRNHGIPSNPDAAQNDQAEWFDAPLSTFGEFSKYLRAIPEEVIAEVFDVPVNMVIKARVYSGIPAWHKKDKEVAIRIFKGIQNEHRSD